jgi:hypothetical protein
MQNTINTEAHALAAIVLPAANDKQFTAAMQAASIATEYVIDSQDMYELGAAELGEFKRIGTELEERRRFLIDPIQQGIDNINAMFRPVRERIQAADRELRARMLEWANKEKARIAAENATREAAAREARERMEREAAEAATAGREEEAFAMRQAAEVMSAPVRSVVVPKTAGVSTRSNWKATVTDLSQLVAFVAANPEHMNLLQANQAAITALAKAQKQGMKVPGVKAWNDAGVTVRTR